MNRRWYVSDFQRIIIYIAVVAAVFLAAMALGWQNLWLLLAAVVVFAVTAVSVIASAARRGAGAHDIVTARVLSVSSPPPNTGIAARCDMVLEVLLPGRGGVRTRHRDPAVPLTRWPQPGQTFPVEVRGGNPRRHLHIRWDLVEQGMVRAPDASPSAGEGGSPAFVWEEENEPIIFSPTPPRPRRPSASTSPTPPRSASPSAPPSAAPPPPAPPPPAPAPPPTSPSSRPPTAATTTTPEAEVFLHETFTDLDETFAGLDEALADFDEGTLAGRDEETVRTPAAPPAVDQPRADPNGHDPDGYDPADFETPRLAEEPPEPAPAATGGPGFETITLSDFDPADVDIRDFSDEPSAVTTMPPDDEPPAAPLPAAARPEAAPPPAEQSTPAVDQAAPVYQPPTTRPIPQPRDPGPMATPAAGSSVTRPVKDLDRALRFYRDVLGFTVVFASAKSAVVEHQGSRVVLDERSIQPSPGEVHLNVTDIEAICAAVRASAGEVVESPAPANGGSGLQLWQARLRDPDGHAIEVIEWRSSEAK